MGRTNVSFRRNCVVPHEGVLLKEAETATRFNDSHRVDCGTLYVEETKLTWIRDRGGKGISIDRDLIDSYKFEDYYDKCILRINMKAEIVLRKYFQCSEREDYNIEQLDKISITFNGVAKERMSKAMKQVLPLRLASSPSASEDEDDGDELEYSE